MSWNRPFGIASRLQAPARGFLEEDAGESSASKVPAKGATEEADDDVDPLDAFMAGVNEQARIDRENIGQSKPLDIVSHNDSSEYEGHKGNKDFRKDDDGGEDDDGAADFLIDSDDEASGPVSKSEEEASRKTRIQPLPPVDHSTIKYPTVRRTSYRAHSSLQAASQTEIDQFRDQNQIHVTGSDVPRPLLQLSHASFDPKLINEMSRLGYHTPTAIQAQAIPVILSGRDILGLAKTGSGKTLAYGWPLLVHVLEQVQMQLGDGPIALVLSPTRELAAQIYSEIKKFAKLFNIRVAVIYGGAGKWEMTKSLRESPEVVVATPGRFIEMVRLKATNLLRVSMVVLDEADRMFEMGFEYQMRSIVQNTRPDRQLIMFSATMKKRIESFARELLRDVVRVVVGTIGQANADIQQKVELVDAEEKWPWLATRIDDFAAEGKVLIFVLSKAGTEELALRLREWFVRRQLAVGVDCLHGDKDQAERSRIMQRFCKTAELPILVATDIAARGLDVQDIRTVINYDIARNIETYVHRIGRTGRLGVQGVHPGTAYTLLTKKDSSFAVDLVHNLSLSKQAIPAEVRQLAERDPKWARANQHNKLTRGLGLGSGQRAMTSEMLAKGSTRPRWLPSSSSSSSTSHAEAMQPELLSTARASGIATGTASEGSSLKGFVRASSEYHSVHTAVPSPATTEAAASASTAGRKRSRWDS